MSIVLEELCKRFGGQAVVDRVSLDVHEGELFVLLGASGSGKSTILRLIAGLSQPDGGRIVLKGRDVTTLAPQRRGTGFVFQNYSIFRHMSVAANVEFGMRLRHKPAAERARRREELLEMVDLAGMGSREPHQLSGGQQQRVALARALAYEPEVLLLDEPFGALDVKIRAQLRRSLKSIQDRLGVTTILVTHDQEEAFELADRIGVIERGQLLEVGDPKTLYDRPRTLFVSTFLGASNVLVGRAERGQAHFGPLSLPIPASAPHEDGARVQVLVRPENVVLSAETPPATTPVLGRGRIVEQSFTGPQLRVRLQLPPLPATRQVAPAPPFGFEGLLVDALLAAEAPLPSADVWVGLRAWHVLEEPGMRLLVLDTASGSTAHLALAGALMTKLDADATIVTVSAGANDADEVRREMERRQASCDLGRAEILMRPGNPAKEIALRAQEAIYDLLVLPVGEPRGAEQRPSAAVISILQSVHLPALVVKGEPRAVSRVLVCTAAGEPGKNDVLVGGRLARALDAAVTVLYVMRGAGEPGAAEKAHLERAAATLRALGVASETRVRADAIPAHAILAEARHGDHDVIVVGRHLQHGRAFSPDDVTQQVLIGADRPVLVVPAEIW